MSNIEVQIFNTNNKEIELTDYGSQKGCFKILSYFKLISYRCM